MSPKTMSSVYPEIKKLLNQKEWKSYEEMLKEEKRNLFYLIETEEIKDFKLLEERVQQVKEINRILRLPYDFVEEYEELQKENNELVKS